MRPHPDNRWRIVWVGGAGAIWGLGLARLIAEVSFWPPLYDSPLTVAGVAAVCAGTLLALWRLADPPASCLLLPASCSLIYVTGIVSLPLAGGVLLVGGAMLAMLMAWGKQTRWTVPTLLGLTTLALYLRTLLPSVGQADTFEFQVIVPRLGVAHPTGYPLYVLLGKLFTLLPLGNVAWRVNLASAVCATGAVLVLYALLLRLTSRWLPALVTALAFAFSATFWSQAVVAEVYTLHNLFVMVILWLLLAHKTSEVSKKPARSAAHRWQATLFLLGLSFTNHLTTALLLPAVALALLWDRPRLRLRDWLIAGGLLLLGLSVYLFIPLRWPALNHGARMGLRQFAAYVTGGQFHGALQLSGWRDSTRWAIVGRLMQQPFGWVGLGLAGMGVVELAARQRRALALTSVTFLTFAFYGLVYYVPDISVFLLPAHLILALWIGIGIALLARLASRFVPCVTLLTLLPLSLIWTNLPLVDQSHNQGNYAWGQYVLSLPLAKDSAVLADPEKFAPLYYLQQIKGVRSDLDLILLGSEELYQTELAARLGTEQTVYLARYLPHLEGLYLRSVGPVVQVSKSASLQVYENASAAYPVSFGGEIQLLDAEVIRDPLGRAIHHLTLYWQAETETRGDLVVRLRLMDGENRARWESEEARPVSGLYPTNAWPTDAIISDYHEIAPPPWLPRGEYTLQVGLFPPFSDAGLTTSGGATPWLSLGALTVDPPSDPPPLPRKSRYLFASGAWLTGYNLSNESFAGTPFTTDLSWRRVEENEEIRLTWADSRGQKVKTDIFPLTTGALRSRHTITAPQTAGSYTLRVGLTNKSARCNWLALPTDDCPLATIEVTPAQEGLTNFANLMLLVDAEISRATAHPGEIIPITLHWRALRTMDEDYTAFVHLLGPDGQLHGQVDAWPVQGSYPTSQWASGEKVSDPYQVQLTPDGPAGRYRVEVGWYLLATMQRLQTIDANGRPTGDSFIAGEFDVSD